MFQIDTPIENEADVTSDANNPESSFPEKGFKGEWKKEQKGRKLYRETCSHRFNIYSPDETRVSIPIPIYISRLRFARCSRLVEEEGKGNEKKRFVRFESKSNME